MIINVKIDTKVKSMDNRFNSIKAILANNFNFLCEADSLLTKYYKENSSYDKSVFVCFKGFIDNSKNYIYSVYEDISDSENSSDNFICV